MSEEANNSNPNQVSILRNIKNTQLELAVRLATKRIPVKDLYKLVPGVIIQFDVLASDPVDLMINQHKFAKGIVIELSGHYGYMVQEIEGSDQDK